MAISIVTPTKVLEVWEQCSGKNNLYSALALVSLASNEESYDKIARWSIEKRDAHLFHIRKALFGEQFINTANCPNCKAPVEWTMDYDDFQVPDPADIPDDTEFVLENPDYKIHYRLPTTNDLAGNNESGIIENCIVSYVRDKTEQRIKDIPEQALVLVMEQMEKKSHVSNISMALNCPECKHEWSLPFDIIPYLKTEIDQWAKRFLEQVFVLAKAFGWPESTIINMSQIRRNYYLNLLNS